MKLEIDEWIQLGLGGEISLCGTSDYKQVGFRVSPDQEWGYYRTLRLEDSDLDALIAALQRLRDLQLQEAEG